MSNQHIDSQAMAKRVYNELRYIDSQLSYIDWQDVDNDIKARIIGKLSICRSYLE